MANDAQRGVGRGKRIQRRVWIAGFLGGVALITGVGVEVHSKLERGRVSTDDAYVGADVASVTPLIAGHVAAVFVDDAQSVQSGQLLATLDPTSQSLARASAEANLSQALRSHGSVAASDRALAATVQAKLADAATASDTYRRLQALFAQGWATKADLTQARDAAAAAKAEVEEAKQQLAANAAQIATDPAQTPAVEAAKAELAQADVDLADTQIRAPIAGVVSQRNVQTGQQVAPGTPLMAIVPLNNMYVDANFTEDQLASVRPGQPATLHSDLYGGKVTFHGRVVGLGGGTGSAFALIPAQNATGNWIKVVQRIPVRIKLDPAELKQYPLRVGLSMSATIRTDD